MFRAMRLTKKKFANGFILMGAAINAVVVVLILYYYVF